MKSSSLLRGITIGFLVLLIFNVSINSKAQLSEVDAYVGSIENDEIEEGETIGVLYLHDEQEFRGVSPDFLDVYVKRLIKAFDFYKVKYRDELTNAFRGINLHSRASDYYIEGNSITNNHPGIYFWGVRNTTVVNNKIISNSKNGIIIKYNSHNNTLKNNDIMFHKTTGISLREESVNNFIVGNNIISNNNGVKITSKNTSNNTFYNNNFYFKIE